ncbi:MAG: hypothetical protein JWM32_135 [Verrucomicrobia bacterium]|nr:hypothetical protein [Verrucomicrobiota bacterium]
MSASPIIPVVLFAYARPDHLARVLRCLRANEVPLVLAFADGPNGSANAEVVKEVRKLLRSVTWCDLRLTERAENLGLGRNVLAGVTEVASRHDAFIVWEDDLVCAPGTYAWMCAALRRYAADPRVMSVTAWTHPRVVPSAIGDQPYFDGRAECWGWGAWARSWRGMSDEGAMEKLASTLRYGTAADAYGADLPVMAKNERQQNTWAVRWTYHHLKHGGLCLRPPWSMVENIGFDATATNAADAGNWANGPLRSAPPIPESGQEPVLHPDCRRLWTRANPGRWAGPWRRLRANRGWR